MNRLSRGFKGGLALGGVALAAAGLRRALGSRPRYTPEERPHYVEALQACSTDFTELLYDGGNKKAWLMVMLDIASKWAGGWSVGPSGVASRPRTVS